MTVRPSSRHSTPAALRATGLRLSSLTKQLHRDHVRSGAYGPDGPYECPLYKYPVRTDRFFICMVHLTSKQFLQGGVKELPPADHWVMRGVALVCSTDFE